MPLLSDEDVLERASESIQVTQELKRDVGRGLACRWRTAQRAERLSGITVTSSLAALAFLGWFSVRGSEIAIGAYGYVQRWLSWSQLVDGFRKLFGTGFTGRRK